MNEEQGIRTLNRPGTQPTPAGRIEGSRFSDYWQVWGTSVQEPGRWQPWGPAFATEEGACRDLLGLQRGAVKGDLLAAAGLRPERLRVVKFPGGIIRKAFPKLRNRSPRAVVVWFRRALRAYRAALERVRDQLQVERADLTNLVRLPSDRRLAGLNARIDAFNDEAAALRSGPQQARWRRLSRLTRLTWVELERATRDLPVPAARLKLQPEEIAPAGRDLVAPGDNLKFLPA
jgi:hypothetical protein